VEFVADFMALNTKAIDYKEVMELGAVWTGLSRRSLLSVGTDPFLHGLPEPEKQK